MSIYLPGSYVPVSQRFQDPDKLEEYRAKRRAYQKLVRERNPKKSNASAKASYDRNKETRLESRRIKHEKFPWTTMIQTAKRTARKQNLPFDLDNDYLESIFPKDNMCPVFGFEFTISKQKESRDRSPSLDKIIPKLGYVKGNITIVSLKANRMKNNGTLEDLQKVLEYYKTITV